MWSDRERPISPSILLIFDVAVDQILNGRRRPARAYRRWDRHPDRSPYVVFSVQLRRTSAGTVRWYSVADCTTRVVHREKRPPSGCLFSPMSSHGIREGLGKRGLGPKPLLRRRLFLRPPFAICATSMPNERRRGQAPRFLDWQADHYAPVFTSSLTRALLRWPPLARKSL